MNTLRDNLIDLIGDPGLQKLLRQLADHCDQADMPAFLATLESFEKQLKAHDYRGLQPLTEQLHALLVKQAPTQDLSQLITIAAAYLKLLQDQQINAHPLVVVHTLNQCEHRSLLPELTAEDWLIPDIRPMRVRPVRSPELDVDTHRLASVFQVLLLRWLQRNDGPALKRLAQICRYLRSRSNLPDIMLLWQTAEALAIALTESALTDPVPAQRLLGKLTAAIRIQTDKDEAALQRDFPQQLLKQMLLEIARADSQQNLIVDLQETQQLDFIRDQKLLAQALGWPSTPSKTTPKTTENADQGLAWLEQMDSDLDQYHQHLHHWFKHPTADHKQALLNTLFRLQTDAEARSLTALARLYQLMQQLLSVVEHSSDSLTDLLEQAYQQLNQQIESLFESRPAPEISSFAARVENFVSRENATAEKAAEKSTGSAFIVDADEYLQSIQTQLRQWQKVLPSPPPEALSALFSDLSMQARDTQQHTIADLAESLSVLLRQSPTDSQTMFELTDNGHSKLSEMQEQLAQDLPFPPAREQLAAISNFIKTQRQHKSPIRQSSKSNPPALTGDTLNSLKSRQRSSQRAMQSIADQHVLLMQQLRRLQNQQPDLVGEMQHTLIKAQSALSAQMYSQAQTEQTLATAALQSLNVIQTALEDHIAVLNQQHQHAITLVFESGNLQIPSFMIQPFTEVLDNLFNHLLATDSDKPVTLQVRAGVYHANICLKISILNADGKTDDLPPLSEAAKADAEKFLQTIGGQIQSGSDSLQLQLPRVDQPLRCLITRCGDKFFAIVAEAIDSISHIKPDAFDYQPGQSMSYQHDGKTCQLVSPEPRSKNAGHIISDGQPVIITHDDKQPVAVTVDEVINTQNCVFELLGPQLIHYPTIRGVSVNQGRLLMLLDTEALKTFEKETATSPIT